MSESAGVLASVIHDSEIADGSLTRVVVNDVPVLDEGELDADGCVTCPWQGSRFRIEDGV